MKTRSTKVLVTGACGQIGTELVAALRKAHGAENVIASDLHAEVSQEGLYVPLNVCDKNALDTLVRLYGITEIYHLAAMLSAKGEQHPLSGWELNMDGLLNVLETAKKYDLKVFWPSSIAVFGPDAPKNNCPQDAALNPATVYGISKVAGEHWCAYYKAKYSLDVRSLRFPGLISYSAQAGGGTTDYAVDIFHAALESGGYRCFLRPDSRLPMLYMPDAIRAVLQLMAAPQELLGCTSYNMGGLDFTPAELAEAITQQLPAFTMDYAPDSRQQIADSWPDSIDDAPARHDWGWQPNFGLKDMALDMLQHLQAAKLTTV